MGGTGNMGEQPTGQSAALGAAPSTAVPGWSGSGPATSPTSAPTTTASPELRPYEQMTPSTGTVANLGLPSAGAPTAPAAPTDFNHDPFPTHAAPPPTYAGREEPGFINPAPAPVDPNAPSPSDWLYPGNLPMNFDSRVPIDPSARPQAGGNFGMPWAYSPTGPNYTAGYGAAGNFGGVTGRGPQQQGLQDQVLLPQMAAGTKLQDAQIDQYNRVSRADYDRYMRLYGVGYDLPAYQQALNGLAYQQNMVNYTPGGGG
jgi:hypothetical protein